MPNPVVSDLLLVFSSTWSGATIASAIGRSIGKPLPLIDRRQFAQLSTRNHVEQERLLHKAVAVAFRSWRVTLQGLPLALFMTLGFVAAQVLPSALALSGSTWLRAAVAGLICGIGVLPTRLLIAAYVRPFLRQVLSDEVSSPNPPLQPTGSAGG
jgi:hypothetical protein